MQPWSLRVAALLWVAAVSAQLTAGAKAPPALLVTTADGPEGSAMVLELLKQQFPGRVIAAVSSSTSAVARHLAEAGAELREPGEPPSPSAFEGVDCAFLLAPLTADRLQRGKELVDAARKAGVPSAVLLSVVGASAESPASLAAYYDLERYLAGSWGPARGSYVVLRTYFYQQNLLLWAVDVRATSKLRLPVGSCLAPLYEPDVADVVAALAREWPIDRIHSGQVYNLTGPRAMTGEQLAAAAADATGVPKLSFEQVGWPAAEDILRAAGGLDASEAALLLDLLRLQTSECAHWPSQDAGRLLGRPPTDISVFFGSNADAFRPKEAALTILTQ